VLNEPGFKTSSYSNLETGLNQYCLCLILTTRSLDLRFDIFHFANFCIEVKNLWILSFVDAWTTLEKDYIAFTYPLQKLFKLVEVLLSTKQVFAPVPV
jgi:hypothetical protein